MQLSVEEYQTIINVLNQISVKVSEASTVQSLIKKLEWLKGVPPNPKPEAEVPVEVIPDGS